MKGFEPIESSRNRFQPKPSQGVDVIDVVAVPGGGDGNLSFAVAALAAIEIHH